LAAEGGKQSATPNPISLSSVAFPSRPFASFAVKNIQKKTATAIAVAVGVKTRDYLAMQVAAVSGSQTSRPV